MQPDQTQNQTPVSADHLEQQIRTKLNARLIAQQIHDQGEHTQAARGAININFSGINAKLEALAPKIKQFVALLGPVLPAQVPLVVGAFLNLYEVIDQQFLNPQSA